MAIKSTLIFQSNESEETEFRKIYYSSLLQQRQENETNRIKIVLISVGATVAGVIGMIKGIQSLPNPFLVLAILIAGYVPWVRVLYVLFKKLEVDIKVIDEKIDRIGTELENEDPSSKEIADKFNEKFHKSLIWLFVGITCILSYILITAFMTGESK